MAFKLPSKTLVKDYAWIWFGDRALDATVEDFKERYDRYLETGDESHLPIREGVEPVRWTLRHLRPRDMSRIGAQSDRDKGAAANAVRLAASIAIVSAAGQDIPRVADATVPGATVADPDILDAIDADPDVRGVVVAIGYEAIRRATLDPK